uniref:TetR/AcrR family transcriptional regulator n=1 Tax=Pseudoclavibacter sp. RFBI5 TaxID=2080578 RepID=UPI0015E3F99E|nr:TetR/AcrR family transcriptional regulator [Pseudoclavibacter sp. RFBI5]
MAWDTERTKQLLLESATRHFSERGFAGSRVDAIAKDAGVNKERIYQYFGDKQALFTSVLQHALLRIFDGAELTGAGPESVGAYAAALFDRYDEHPELPRLLAWEGLETEGGLALGERVARCADKAEAIRSACPWLSEAESRHVLLSVVTLVNGWWTLGQLRGIMLDATSEHADRRSILAAQIAALATPATSSVPQPGQLA